MRRLGFLPTALAALVAIILRAAHPAPHKPVSAVTPHRAGIVQPVPRVESKPEAEKLTPAVPVNNRKPRIACPDGRPGECVEPSVPGAPGTSRRSV